MINSNSSLKGTYTYNYQQLMRNIVQQAIFEFSQNGLDGGNRDRLQELFYLNKLFICLHNKYFPLLPSKNQNNKSWIQGRSGIGLIRL